MKYYRIRENKVKVVFNFRRQVKTTKTYTTLFVFKVKTEHHLKSILRKQSSKHQNSQQTTKTKQKFSVAVETVVLDIQLKLSVWL